MSDPKPHQEDKSPRAALTEFLQEIIGYDKGFYKTIVDLRRQPQVVLHSFLAKENIYVSPFRILISIVGLWLVVNNFIIDWYAMWRSFLESYERFLVKSDEIPHHFDELNRITTQMVGDLISKFYMVIVVLATPSWAYLCYQFTRKYKIDFRTHLAIVGYHSALGFIPSFLFIILIAINFWLFMAVALIIMISPMVGLGIIYNKVYVMVPISAFFEKDGVAIEKTYYRTRWLVTFLLLGLYFALWQGYHALFPMVK